jgi:MYXO-CTERM domain-containing protein
MRLTKKLLGIVACLAWGCGVASAAPMNTAPELEYSQDGINFQPFDVMVGRQKVRNYYNYYGQSGHPAFGTKRDTATAAVYWDEKRKALSLIVVNGAARHGFRTAVQEAKYSFTGLPSSTYLSMRDDPDDISYTRGRKSGSAHFEYKSSTDGLVFSGLEQKPFKMRIELTAVKNLATWRLADGNVHSASDFIDLNDDKPLYIRLASVTVIPPDDSGPGTGSSGGTTGETVSNPPVPEPASAMLAAAAVGLLAARRRRNR